MPSEWLSAPKGVMKLVPTPDSHRAALECNTGQYDQALEKTFLHTPGSVTHRHCYDPVASL